MTARRLVLTAGAMAGIGVMLDLLTPSAPATLAALGHAQRVADAEGAGALVVAAVGALAWLVWAWGVLGLALTALGAAPGLLGWIARSLVRVVLPAGARRAAALTLGIGVALNAPLLAGTALAAPVATSQATDAPIPDWPTPPSSPPATTTAGTAAVPDRPAPGAADHLVVRGDCLWNLAADHLRVTTGHAPGDAEIVRAVDEWWTANATVIGPDPDLLLPGQVLRPPDAR